MGIVVGGGGVSGGLYFYNFEWCNYLTSSFEKSKFALYLSGSLSGHSSKIQSEQSVHRLSHLSQYCKVDKMHTDKTNAVEGGRSGGA